jgi:uncharacterized protein (DUF342 family)
MNEEELGGITENTEPVGEKNRAPYQVTVEPNGVYLTVSPPLSGELGINPRELYAELLARDLHTVKRDAVMRAVSAPTGKPVLVGEYPGPEGPEIKVEVSQTKMEASVEVIPSRKGTKPSIKEMKSWLAEKGVVFGINEPQLELALDRPKHPVNIATGMPATDGTNGRIEYAIDFSKTGKPKEEIDGRVDFHDLNLVFNVRAEDVIAQKIPKTDGIPGSTVTGEAVPAKPGKDIPSPLGKNVYMDEAGMIRAGIDGQIQIINGKINVNPVFEVKEDVDVSTGSITFVGSVIVHGSVQMGFFIKAEGDIEVYGTVSGATLEGNDIMVKNGIQGMQRGHIRAKGKVTAKFIENANVFAQDSVTVAEAILHSNVSAGRKVVVQGRRAAIVGGTVRAGEEILSRVVGSNLATPTSLEVGVNPELRDELSKVKKEMKDVQYNLEQTQKAVQLLKNLETNGTITQEKKEMLLKVTKSYYNLVGQHESLRNRVSDIEQQIEELRNGRIKVSETVHPGVKIVVGTAILPIRDRVSFATFYEENGDVKIGAYR